MTAAQTSPTERYRARLLEAFGPKAAELGWTRAVLQAAAEAAGLSEGETMMAAPRGPIDLADAFAARADEAMLARIADFDLPNMKIRQRVREAVAARLEAQAEHKEAARAMTRALVRRPDEAARLVWRTADRIWRALGDTSTDGNFYSKRAILSGVLASTYARWFSDSDPDMEATLAFLDARIENVMQFEKFKAKRLTPLGGVAEEAAGFLARMRYGSNG